MHLETGGIHSLIHESYIQKIIWNIEKEKYSARNKGEIICGKKINKTMSYFSGKINKIDKPFS